jgi:CheY-like chemotaxis protein
VTETRATASGAARRVLIVEDEAPIRELVRFHLALAGFAVTELGDGAAALDRARTTAFELIVLDIMLPGLDGITLCRALRTEGANPRRVRGRCASWRPVCHIRAVRPRR